MTFECMCRNGWVYQRRIVIAGRERGPYGILAWQEGVSRARLCREMFEKLLEEEFWEPGVIPFVISGYKLFYVYPRIVEYDEDVIDFDIDSAESADPEYDDIYDHIDAVNDSNVVLLESSNVVFVYRKLMKAIRNRSICLKDSNFEFNKKGSYYDISMFKNFCNLKSMCLYSLFIATEDVVEWAVLNKYTECPEFLDVLCIDFPSANSKFNPLHTQLQATAQAVWHFAPFMTNRGAEGMQFHPLIQKLCPGGYSSENTLPDILKLVDPRPDEEKIKPSKKRPSRDVRTPFPPVPIPGVFSERGGMKYRDFRRLKVVCETMAACLLELQPKLTFQEIVRHELIAMYIEGSHKVIKKIAHRWIATVLPSV